MQNETLKGLTLLFMAILIDVNLTSCSGGSDTPTQPVTPPTPALTPDPEQTTTTYSIIGEWFEDLGGNGIINFGVYNYIDDGTMTNYEVSAEKDDLYCYIYDYNGNYTYDGTLLTLWGEHPVLGNSRHETTVKSLTKYDLTYYSEEYAVTEYQHRIIDTYNMNVGETKSVYISDNEFSPQNYYSNHERVAIVNNKGTITAKEIGTAYISITSSIGTAVIRVVVTDPENLFCDFTKYLFANIDDIPMAFGNEYLDVDRSKYPPFVSTDSDDRYSRQYNLYDDQLLNVHFLYGDSKIVRHISPTFREGIDTDAITNYLAKKFDYIKTSETGAHHYGKGVRIMSINDGKIEYEDKTIIITWSPSDRTIIYGIYDDPQSDESETELHFYDFYKLIGASLDEVAEYMGNNYSDSYVTENSDSLKLGGSSLITDGIRHYPKQASILDYFHFGGDDNQSFNGYEKIYEYIEFHYSASGTIPLGVEYPRPNVTDRGPVREIVLKFQENMDIDEVTDKLEECFIQAQTIRREEDSSITLLYLVDPNQNYYVLWNATSRKLTYTNREKINVLPWTHIVTY